MGIMGVRLLAHNDLCGNRTHTHHEIDSLLCRLNLTGSSKTRLECSVVQNSAVILDSCWELFGLVCFLQKVAFEWYEWKRLFFRKIGVFYGLLFYWLDMELFGGAWWRRKGGTMCVSSMTMESLV